MALFRRSSTADPESSSAPPSSVTTSQQPKGRPTPKRRDAQAARKTRTAPPRDRKEARTRMREERARERAEMMDGLRAGDERRYPVRDRGPARAIARSWVDGRRNAGDVFWPVVIVSIALLLTPLAATKAVSTWLLIGYYFLLLADNAWSLYGLSRVLEAKVPDRHSRKGTLPYAFGRSLQSRKRRLPVCQVDRGWTRQVRSGQLDPLA